MKKIIILLIVFVLFIYVHLYPQPNMIPLSVDYAKFKGDKDNIYLEVYISFYQNYLKYIPYNGQYRSEYLTEVDIKQNDSTLFRSADRRYSIVDSLTGVLAEKKFVNMFNYQILPESYLIQISVRDENSSKKGEYVLDITLNPIQKDSLAISDIQLSRHIALDTLKSEFQKNSYLVIPNPEGIYGISLPVIYYYAEIYHLKYSADDSGTYKFRCNITDNKGDTVKSYPERVIRKPGNSAVLVGGHNIITLPSGTYQLNLEVTDQQTQQIVNTSKGFLFLKQKKTEIAKADSLGLIKPKPYTRLIYDQYNEDKLDLEFARAKYISTRKERKMFESLDINGKREFLVSFWKKFDTTPQTEVNEFKQQYFILVDYANKNFSTMKREGWETSRGRVLLTYGAPDNVERYHMLIDKEPYEIWHYHDVEGGAIFVFADLTGFGYFELLHSTCSREIYQPEWETLIRKAGSR